MNSVYQPDTSNTGLSVSDCQWCLYETTTKKKGPVNAVNFPILMFAQINQ